MKNSAKNIFKEMMDQSDEMFFIYNLDEKRFEYTNPAFEKITLKNNVELFKDPALLYSIIHPEDVAYVKEKFERLLSKKTKTLLDFRILRPNGLERWVRLKVYPIINVEKIQYISGIVEDDSSRKASIFNMQKVNGWKDSILEILSHDLRGPIGVVKLLASAIAGKLPKEEYQQIHEWTQTIQDISKRNLDLIKSLLTRESLDTVGVEISKERVNVVWEISEIMKLFLHSAREIKKEFQFTYSDEQIYAEIDSMKFLQIINNLISNALKFTGNNGIIKVHLEELENTVLITVTDNGIGIPKKLQPFLFTKYTKAGRTGVDGEESVGLGMWIVKSLTEAHGGRVWFESEEKTGSKLYVEIPQEGE